MLVQHVQQLQYFKCMSIFISKESYLLLDVIIARHQDLLYKLVHLYPASLAKRRQRLCSICF